MANIERFFQPVTIARAARFALPSALGLLIVVAATLRAWVSDDAYLTFRTIDNFVNGWGLRWNTLERVQTYTHPLWMLLMVGARAVTHEYFYSSIVLSLLLTVAALGILAARVVRAPDRAGLALAILFVSRAFLDYATSGLENALTHLLLALFLWVLLDERPPSPGALFGLALLGSLLAITRLDLLALVGPALAWRFLTVPARRAVGAAALGALPLLAWEAFSLFYYGFLVPNTAYAKLATALPRTEIFEHGLDYLANSLRSDPVTLPVIAAGVVTALSGRRPAHRALAAGLVLYLLYVVSVGGDFMSGRFLTAPLLVAVALLALRLPEGATVRGAACALALLLGLWPSTSPFNFKPDYRAERSESAIGLDGVADERAVYFDSASLWNAPGDGHWPSAASLAQVKLIQSNWSYESWVVRLQFFGIVSPDEFSPHLAPGSANAGSRRRVVIRGAVGILGYHLGPDYHILDYMALGDPLLARLPALPVDPVLSVIDPRLTALKFRTGHYPRRIPYGYYETLVVGENRIRDPRLAAYYDHLSFVVRGPLFDRRRLAEIWRLNTGRYDDLLRAAATDKAAG